jgi:hypothetical protein
MAPGVNTAMTPSVLGNLNGTAPVTSPYLLTMLCDYSTLLFCNFVSISPTGGQIGHFRPALFDTYLKNTTGTVMTNSLDPLQPDAEYLQLDGGIFCVPYTGWNIPAYQVFSTDCISSKDSRFKLCTTP